MFGCRACYDVSEDDFKNVHDRPSRDGGCNMGVQDGYGSFSYSVLSLRSGSIYFGQNERTLSFQCVCARGNLSVIDELNAKFEEIECAKGDHCCLVRAKMTLQINSNSLNQKLIGLLVYTMTVVKHMLVLGQIILSAPVVISMTRIMRYPGFKVIQNVLIQHLPCKAVNLKKASIVLKMAVV